MQEKQDAVLKDGRGNTADGSSTCQHLSIETENDYLLTCELPEILFIFFVTISVNSELSWSYWQEQSTATTVLTHDAVFEAHICEAWGLI